MYKQVIVVRKDLEMSCGKIAAQVAHASVSALEKAREKFPSWVKGWMKEGQKKVVLQVSSEKELLEIYRKTLLKKLPVALIRDRGLTEIPPNTVTAIGIGPAPEKDIDSITGHLKLFK